MQREKRIILLAILLLVCLCGCGGGGSSGGEISETALMTDVPVEQEPRPEEGEIEDDSVPAAVFFSDIDGDDEGEREDFEPYEAPAFADSVFHEDLAEAGDNAWIDVSDAHLGYVGVAAISDSRLKFQVVKDDVVYNYDIASDGTPSILPLQSGDGDYRLRIMENVAESKYAEKFSINCTVVLVDPFTPFLRPNDYADYTRDSLCVRKAAELAATVPDALGVVGRVFDFVTSTVSYDREKAENVRSGYLPVPDETMTTGMGICFDYASLAASMLRSQGIPTKVVFGYVSPNDLYHAWNMFYTDVTGWVTVSYEVSKDSWNRLDLTFSAGGADDRFVGDGGNYADLYFY